MFPRPTVIRSNQFGSKNPNQIHRHLIARAPSNISSSTSESLGKRSYGNKNPWSAKAERERSERSNPLWAATQEPCLTIIMNNLLKALSQHATQSGMNNQAWSSQ